MDAFATDNLFLLEFLVDFVNLEYGLQNDLLSMSGETCVAFQFLDNAPLYVSEEDFAPNQKNIGDPCAVNKAMVKNGKSCIFSLSPIQAENGRYEFNIYLEVFKKMKPGTLPDKISLGETLISIVNLFNDLVNTVGKSKIEAPVTKTLKDTYKIYNASGDHAGNVGVYLRMSCFGKLIVTQFQMNLQDKSVEYKANEGHYLFKYNKKDGGCPQNCGENIKSCYPPCEKDSSYNGSCPNFSNTQYDPNSQQQLSTSCSYNPRNSCPFQAPPSCIVQCPYAPVKCPYASQKPMTPPCEKTITPSCIYKQPMSPPPCLDPCQQYQLQMQQAAKCLNIETPCNECGPPAPPPSQCDLKGNYEEIGATMGGNSLLIRVHKDKQKVEQIDGTDDDHCYCSNSGNSQKQDNKSTKGNPPFCFQLGGGSPTSQNVCIQPPTAETPCGTKVTQLNDPNKEQFILRIGKKTEGINRKNNLELELCTPKGKDLKPPPKFETRDTQCDESSAAPKAKGAKGKAGKGKKKGKK